MISSTQTFAAECTPPEKIPQLYAKEFELDSRETKDVSLKFLPGSPKLATAVHPDRCGARGCETALYLLEGNCAKQVLLFKGKLAPRGNDQSNEKISILTHAQALEGGKSKIKMYEFDKNKQVYNEMK